MKITKNKEKLFIFVYLWDTVIHRLLYKALLKLCEENGFDHIGHIFSLVFLKKMIFFSEMDRNLNWINWEIANFNRFCPVFEQIYRLFSDSFSGFRTLFWAFLEKMNFLLKTRRRHDHGRAKICDTQNLNLRVSPYFFPLFAAAKILSSKVIPEIKKFIKCIHQNFQ